MSSLYDFSAAALDGQPRSLAEYRGKVVLVVNTASQCGFTPQYAALEELRRRYAPRGFEVLGFPCNQFGAQEPGTAADISAFCDTNYGITFPMFGKIDVNGADAHPLFQWLTESAPGLLGTERIKWNFTKFLVGRDGSVFKRYSPHKKPEELTADIEKLLEVR
jgi:glutathione peroxidase